MIFPKSKSKAKSKQGSQTDCSVYLRFIPTIEKLIKVGWLIIDLREIHVSIDYKLHLIFLDDDKKYLAFFDKIRAYMNYKRGLLQVKKLIEPDDRINFLVFRSNEVYKIDGKEVSLEELFDAESFENISSDTKVKTLLVGYATSEKIDYTPFKDTMNKE